MASRDGNGWVRCALGHEHWGRYGAAGLLAYTGPPGDPAVLLQRRVGWSHHGGTWGLPGGAADSHETPVQAALREAAEECGVPQDAVTVHGIYHDDHGGWSYHSVIAAAPAPFDVYPASEETDDVRWVPAAAAAATLELHPGLAAHWDELRTALEPLNVIVDAANVVGSRPDGWWRDRPGAAAKLIAGIDGLAGRGVAELPAALARPAPADWYPDYTIVLEGQARAADPQGPVGTDRRLRVVSAPGSGDDTIAALAAELPGRPLVVTADRELRGRCERAGALVTGPRWLTELIGP
jgi:8-oxo-dGTP diphosphatase